MIHAGVPSSFGLVLQDGQVATSWLDFLTIVFEVYDTIAILLVGRWGHGIGTCRADPEPQEFAKTTLTQ